MCFDAFIQTHFSQYYIYKLYMLPNPGTGDILFQLMAKDKQLKRRATRPNTTPSPTRNMDSSSLIGQTMKVQQWLNEKTLKTLQVSKFIQ